MPVTELTTQPQAYPATCSLWSWNRNSTNHTPDLPESSMLGSASRWCKRRGERFQSGDEPAPSYLSPVGFLSATNSLESCSFTLATTVPSNGRRRIQVSDFCDTWKIIFIVFYPKGRDIRPARHLPSSEIQRWALRGPSLMFKRINNSNIFPCVPQPWEWSLLPSVATMRYLRAGELF